MGQHAPPLSCQLGRPQAEYGAFSSTEPEADTGGVRPELEYRRIDSAERAALGN